MSSQRCFKIWNSFERKNEEGRTLKFDVGNIPEDTWSTAVEFMLGSYIKEDVWWVAAGTAQDPDAIEEYRVLLTSIVKLGMSVACFLADGDGSGRTLVGVNMCMPQKKDNFVDHTPPKTKAGLVSLRLFAEAMKVTAIYDTYDVDEYLMGAGLSVAPEFRGMGLAVEMLTARFNLTKSLGFHVTGGIFTSEPAQKVGEKAGMTCLHEIPYTKFGKKCDVKFKSDTKKLKFFGKRVS